MATHALTHRVGSLCTNPGPHGHVYGVEERSSKTLACLLTRSSRRTDTYQVWVLRTRGTCLLRSTCGHSINAKGSHAASYLDRASLKFIRAYRIPFHRAKMCGGMVTLYLCRPCCNKPKAASY